MSVEPITVLLDAARAGDATVGARLFDALYGEFRKLARFHRRRWRGNDTLNTTALIHEAFIKLSNHDAARWSSRTHLLATASKAMRHILVNYALRQSAAKRGGNALQVPLEDVPLVAETTAEEMLSVDQLLKRLEATNPRRCRVAECRVFGGMSVRETAQALGISAATVKREWQLASAWLYQNLQDATL